MSDIALTWDPINFQGAMALVGGDLSTAPDQELATAVITSIFSWARADGEQGWWGDSYPDVENDQLGSKLWTLRREKLTTQTINKARDIIMESLQWLLDDQVASRVEVQVERRGLDGLDILVTIYRVFGEVTPLRFETQWEAIRA